MPRTNGGPTLAANIRTLLARGVPAAAFAVPNAYYRTARGGKLHATQGCSRLRNAWPSAEWIDLTTAADNAFCASCVEGPTNHGTQANLDAAARAARAADALGKLEVALENPDTVTWRLVTAARAALTLLTDAARTDGLHEQLAEWLAPFLEQARTVHARMRAAAEAGDDPDALLRGCVVDNLGHAPSHGGPDKIEPPIPDSALDGEKVALPALAISSWGRKGHGDLAQSAWTAWSARVKADGDLTAARTAAQDAGVPAPDAVPYRVEQFPTGPARLEHPAGRSPWEQLLAEWRHAVSLEIVTLIGLWERRYRAAMAAAADAPAQVLLLNRYTRDTLAQVNQATAILGRLELAGDPAKELGLVLAPEPVAVWLHTYGTAGLTRSYGQAPVERFTEALPGDTAEVLELALRLFDKPANSYHAKVKLTESLTAARGILAPAG